MAIILIVPMCLLAGIGGRAADGGMDNNMLTQIGFIVLIGLAAKNAILIVEFAKQEEEQGHDTVDAAVEACRLRLRPDPDDLLRLHPGRAAAGHFAKAPVRRCVRRWARRSSSACSA